MLQRKGSDARGRKKEEEEKEEENEIEKKNNKKTTKNKKSKRNKKRRRGDKPLVVLSLPFYFHLIFLLFFSVSLRFGWYCQQTKGKSFSTLSWFS